MKEDEAARYSRMRELERDAEIAARIDPRECAYVSAAHIVMWVAQSGYCKEGEALEDACARFMEEWRSQHAQSEVAS